MDMRLTVGDAASILHGRASLVTWLCWIGLFSEGYDIGVFGGVLPELLRDPRWRLSPGDAAALATAAIIGMFFGATAFGMLSDRYGRKRCFLGCFALFSIATGCAALAPTTALFAALRFVAGFGIGGIVPICAALTTEFAPPGRANREFALMYSGYSLGILASAVAAYLLLAGQGWRVVMGLGALPVLLSPLIAWLLPESRAYLAARGRAADAMKLADRYGLVAPPAETPFDDAGKQRPASPLTLLAKGSRRATIGFWLATFAGMILVYGLNTWLPQIMRAAGYDLGPSILFLGVFATASAFGGVALGRIADIAGRRRTIAGAFLLGATAILLLSWRAALPVTYALVALAGVGSTAAAVIVTSYLSSYFPAPARATAVGSAVSFSRAGAVSGPLLGGFIATHRLGVQWNFYAFALVALLAALSIQLVPDRKIASAGGDA